MFLIEIKKIAFRYQCCCVIIFAETTKLRIQAYKVLEDITSIIACQEKKLCLSYAICRYSMELYDSHAFFDCSFKSGNSHKCSQNLFLTMILPDKDNFARYGMKTWIKLSLEKAFFLVFKVIASSYLNSLVFLELYKATMIVLKTYRFPYFFS